MFNGCECPLSGFPADFDIGFGNGSHDHGILAGFGCLRQFLNEGNKIVKGAGWQVSSSFQLLAVGYQLIHEDQAGTCLVEEFCQFFRTGRNVFLVRFFDDVVKARIVGIACQLHGHFTPECVDGDARKVIGAFGSGRIQGCADKNCHIGFRQGRQSGFF